LANNLVGDPATRDFYVYLPPGYDTTTERFPVVYVLHGGQLHAGSYFKGIQSAQEALRQNGAARAMIFVFPDAFNAFIGSFYLSSPTIGDYETYVTKELANQIDATYRTIPSRESRGITGCSMGGVGALHLGFKYPEVFSVVAANSGVYDWEHDPG
jgi:enterochelin esterase-like enzyme